MNLLDPSKVYVNVAPTLLYGGSTGIQRVVRELERYLDKQQVAGLCYEFGGLFGGRWVTAESFRKAYSGPSLHESEWVRALRLVVPQRVRTLARRVFTRLRGRKLQGNELPAGSVVLDVDAVWIDEWGINYGLDLRRVTLVYDLIPYSHPQFCTPEHANNFQRWLRKAVKATDACISISRSAMDACQAYVQDTPGARIRRYGYFHLGCDFSVADQVGDVTLPEALRSEKYFLIVGSIEPRKNHSLAIQAFEAYRRAGGNWSLVVVGRPGWCCDEIISAMTTSSCFGQTLHWFANADDPLLARIYREAGALVIPSYIEGFGLPLIEGAHWGCPVIASDIPVFREVGDDFANFFAPADAAQLEARLWEAERGVLPKRMAPGQVVGLSWKQSAMQFAEEIARLLKD